MHTNHSRLNGAKFHQRLFFLGGNIELLKDANEPTTREAKKIKQNSVAHYIKFLLLFFAAGAAVVVVVKCIQLLLINKFSYYRRTWRM